MMASLTNLSSIYISEISIFNFQQLAYLLSVLSSKCFIYITYKYDGFIDMIYWSQLVSYPFFFQVSVDAFYF